MKLCRYGAVGAEKPAVVDAAGQLRDLTRHCADIDPAAISPEGLARLSALDIAALPVVSDPLRLGPPVSGTSKFICIGLNYACHAKESGMLEPAEPVIFLKAPSSICGPNDDTIKPLASTKLDWEVELGVVIGTRAHHVSETEALSHVAGYCLVNDVSERAFQLQSSQWDKGKGCDTFGPIGPWLLTSDEVTDPQSLDLWLDVNGARMQSGNTRSMTFGVRFLISYISRYMTLMPGDIIATGTPSGVGMGIKPDPIWLRAGDEVRLGISKLGVQQHAIVAHPLFTGRPN